MTTPKASDMNVPEIRARIEAGERVDFSGADLTGADLSGLKFPITLFEDTVLTRASFDGSDLDEGAFLRSLIEGTSFRGASLRSVDFIATSIAADFTGADLSRAYFQAPSVRYVDTKISLRGCNFTGANLRFIRGLANCMEGVIIDGATLDRELFRAPSYASAIGIPLNLKEIKKWL